MAPQGRICVLADSVAEPLTLIPAFHEKELTITGSSDGWDYPAHAAWFFHTLRQRAFPLEDLYDCHIAARDLIPTFVRLAKGKNAA